MRKCKCGNDVANNAKACPKCGHRFTSGFVKFLAWFCLIVFGIMIVGIIAAENSGNPPAVAQSMASTPASKPVTTPAPAPKKTPADLIAARKTYAKVIDQQLLDMGIESKTYTMGAQAKTLVIEDALAGRVRQNAIQKNDALFDNLRTLGFTRLEYTNSFEGEMNYAVVWDIKP